VIWGAFGFFVKSFWVKILTVCLTMLTRFVSIYASLKIPIRVYYYICHVNTKFYHGGEEGAQRWEKMGKDGDI
jgi:hypothetical protein